MRPSSNMVANLLYSSRRWLHHLRYGIGDFLLPSRLPLASLQDWEQALSLEWRMFQERPVYLKKFTDCHTPEQVREVLLAEAHTRLEEYNRVGYPFADLFRSLRLTSDRRVLQIAAGVFSELLPLVEENPFRLYLEDPLFDSILSHVDLRSAWGKAVVEYCTLPAERLQEQYSADSFDVVVANNVLNHTYDPEHVLDQIIVVAKPAGTVFLHHIDQPEGYQHPVRVVRRQIANYLSRQGVEVVFQSDFVYPDRPKKRHSWMFRRK